MLEIQTLAWDRYNNMVGLNHLLGQYRYKPTIKTLLPVKETTHFIF
jgi:hypothetical protein